MNNISDEQLIKNEDRIDRYLRGEMTSEEEAQFFNDVKTDETLRSQTEALAQLTIALDKVGREQDRELIEKIKNIKVVSPMRRYMAIAACIICICFVGFQYYDYTRVTGLGDEYANTFPSSTIIRGEENTQVDKQLKVLFDNVEKGEELTSTLTQLTTMWQKVQSDTYNDYTDYAPYIGWNLAIGHLKNNDKQEAKQVLMQMEKMYPAGTAIGDKVKELLEKI